MSKEDLTVNKIPLDENLANFGKFLMGRKWYSEFKRPESCPVTSPTITSVEEFLRQERNQKPSRISTTGSISQNKETYGTITAIAEFDINQFFEEQKSTQTSEQQTLNRIKDLRRSVINKLMNDKKTKRPNSDAYQREIKVDNGKLALRFNISSPDQDGLEITFETTSPTDSSLRKTIDKITVKPKGIFKYTKHNAESLTIIKSISNERFSVTPEDAQEVEKLMNLYLQAADTGRFPFIRKIANRFFSHNHHPQPKPPLEW